MNSPEGGTLLKHDRDQLQIEYSDRAARMSGYRSEAVPARPALSLRGVAKRYDDAPVLTGIDLDVGQREFLTLLGPSGCGKSTLLRLVAGFETPDAGTIEVLGKSVNGVPPYARPLTMMFQSLALFPHMRVGENVGFGLRARGIAKAACTNRVGEALELVDLAGFGHRRVQELSGGQRQRVALARCLAIRPALLLLDEPLGALDLQLRHQLQGELKRIQKAAGCTFIFVTHDQDEAMVLADRIGVMRAGAIEQLGTPADIYHRPSTAFVARFVGAMNLVPAKVLAAAGIATPFAPPNTTLAIRPERLALTAKSAALPQGDIHLDGTVKSVAQVGPMLRYSVYTSCGTLEAASVAQRDVQPITVGDSVVLNCRSTDIHLLKES
jgi:ABC-type Fe3+/spermidine/putrescine transport system ATPase subunit